MVLTLTAADIWAEKGWSTLRGGESYAPHWITLQPTVSQGSKEDARQYQPQQ
jgi:hypothetical protein